MNRQNFIENKSTDGIEYVPFRISYLSFPVECRFPSDLIEQCSHRIFAASLILDVMLILKLKLVGLNGS